MKTYTVKIESGVQIRIESVDENMKSYDGLISYLDNSKDCLLYTSTVSDFANTCLTNNPQHFTRGKRINIIRFLSLDCGVLHIIFNAYKRIAYRCNNT